MRNEEILKLINFFTVILREIVYLQYAIFSVMYTRRRVKGRAEKEHREEKSKSWAMMY